MFVAFVISPIRKTALSLLILLRALEMKRNEGSPGGPSFVANFDEGKDAKRFFIPNVMIEKGTPIASLVLDAQGVLRLVPTTNHHRVRV